MAETIATTLEALRGFLQSQGLVVNGGASDEETGEFERRYGVQLPDEVRAYFGRINGVVGGHDGAWDDEMIALWELRDVRPLAEEVENCEVRSAEEYFVFADWSIWAHGYAIRLSGMQEKAPVFIVAKAHVERVANSLEEFLRGYIRRDPRVLYGVPLAR